MKVTSSAAVDIETLRLPKAIGAFKSMLAGVEAATVAIVVLPSFTATVPVVALLMLIQARTPGPALITLPVAAVKFRAEYV